MSLVCQDFRDFDILVVDGGSTDGTVDFVKKMRDVHPNVLLISEPDLGIYDAMNKGLHHSRGTWVYFMGSDDLLYSTEALSAFVKAVEPEVDLIYGNVYHRQANKFVDGEFDLAKLFQKTICHQAIFYRRDLCAAVGWYDLRYKVCADWGYNLRCFAMAKKIKYVDAVFCDYDGSGFSSTRKDLLFLRDKYRLISDAFGVSLMSGFFTPCRYDFRRYSLDARRGRDWVNFGKYLFLFLHHSALFKFKNFFR